ncbi:MFS transporter [Saccharopolyspora sp. K220]|uniref:MFS transporter n=1 Tax=Saccharopolyspora soli TaxID=2926618 RepID=UPI001F574501|nr:MFS transporter [Saccharopolyspora soli]MCI2419566.1 MFS transporter [Saccharopolyspora soli]
MPVAPPERNDAPSNEGHPWWTLIGPGFAAIIGLFMLTAVYRADLISPVQMGLGLSGPEFLMMGIVAYLIAAAIAFPLGFRLGVRFLMAVTLPAIGVMFIGVLLIAFSGGAGMFLVGRVLTGLGAGAAIGATTALVRGIKEQRNIVAAVVAALGVLAVVVAPFINQVISGALSFRWTFLAAVPFLFAALIASAVIGIVQFVVAKRPAQPGPYGMPYPSPGPQR